jgi:5'-nucleotidase
MGKGLGDKLVVAISSRALFDLDESHRIYESEGVEAYRQYQIAHEDEVLSPGDAFALVQKLLGLNEMLGRQLVEVVLVSRNSADTGLRVFNSIQQHGLGISRAAFVGGRSPYPYLAAFGCHLFLSTHVEDVRSALENGFAAATILSAGARRETAGELRFAFDGDAVLFSDEAERVFQQGGLEAFQTREQASAREPLGGGPFKPFLAALNRVQQAFPQGILPDPYGAGHRALGAGPRARHPHPARMGHPPGRIAVPRRPGQVGVPRGLQRRRVLRRPARALRAGPGGGRHRSRAPRRQQRAADGQLARPRPLAATLLRGPPPRQ